MNILISWVLVVFLLGQSYGGDVRLVETSDDGYSGRVEVTDSDEWFGLCGDQWDEYEAMVVCRELFPSLSVDGASGYTVDDPTNGEQEFVSIVCEGNEATLHDCPQSILDMACDNKRAAVSCAGGTKKEMDLRDDDLKVRAVELLLQLLKAKK